MLALSIVNSYYHHNDKENSEIEGLAHRIT